MIANLYPPAARRVNPRVSEDATCENTPKTPSDLRVQETGLVKWVMKTPREVRLKSVMRGQALVYDEAGRLLGAALRTDTGSWWSSVPHDDGFDILEDHRLRRDAVARIVAESA